jgi:phosphoglycolate phosphatase-like HAD superfamily hydrolase
VTADDVSRLKPDPEGLLKATALMGARSDLAVYLGDSARDIEASRRAGIISAAVLWGFGDGDKLRAEGPDFVFKDPADALTQLTH